MKKLPRNRLFLMGFLAALTLLCCRPAMAGSSTALDLAQYRGKVVLLDFWASWCAPCLESFPWMQQIQQKYSGRGLVVIAVNVDHEPSLAARVLQSRDASFPVIFDPDGQLAQRFHVNNMPSSFYIDRAGNIRYTHPGFRNSDRADAERELAALVGEP